MNTQQDVDRSGDNASWRPILFVFLAVAATQLWFVARLGNDIPHWDQWGSEGRDLYPRWVNGELTLAEFFRPHSEHRIVFTKIINLGLFILNGQWDPLVQLLAGVLLRAAAAAACAGVVMRGASRHHAAMLAVAATALFLPLLAWENVLWGFQSHATIVIGLVATGIGLITSDAAKRYNHACGWMALVAAQFAMGAGLTVTPVMVIWVLFGWRHDLKRIRLHGVMLAVLIACTTLAWSSAEQHAGMHSGSMVEAALALSRLLAWPHAGAPIAMIATLAPLLLFTSWAGIRRHLASPEYSGIVLLGGWAITLAAALAWSRGADGAFAAVIPSRYVDFLVLLNLCGLAGSLALSRIFPCIGRLKTTHATGIWMLFIALGYAGVGMETTRWVIGPRWRDPEAPIRRAVAFQTNGDPAVFAGVPTMFWPSPDLDLMQNVLHDPRMSGRLPPSFQPERPLGPLSRATRWILEHAGLISIALGVGGLVAPLQRTHLRPKVPATASAS